jgi:glycosyltransferase involved in cell wall biosynthesis
MRVALVTSYYPPHVGGIATQVQGTAQELARLGVETHVIARYWEAVGTGTLERDGAGVIVHRIIMSGPRWQASPGFIWACVRLMRQLQPDIVHAHELLLPTTAALAAKRAVGCPVVVTVHSSGVGLGECARLRRTRFGKLRTEYVRNAVDRFVAVSKPAADDMAEIGIPSEKRVVIPNGIDMEHFAPVDPEAKLVLRRRLGLPDGVLAIYTGRLSPEKRILLLAKTWPQFRQYHPQATLVVVGDGPEGAALRESGADGVVCAGAQSNVAPYLQAADLFVMPSVSEGFSLSTLEALACALPVVATTVGAIPELVADPQMGRLVAPDDMTAFVAALCKLFACQDAWPQMGAQAREYVMQHYSLAGITRRLLTLYQQL